MKIMAQGGTDMLRCLAYDTQRSWLRVKVAAQCAAEGEGVWILYIYIYIAIHGLFYMNVVIVSC